MTIRLLAALIALGLVRLASPRARGRAGASFRRWVHSLRDVHGAARVLLVLLIPALACLLLASLLHYASPTVWVLLPFDVLVLLLCFGPRDVDADLAAILHAADLPGRERAARALDDDGEPIAWNAVALCEAVAYAALRRRFGTLFWFFLLGPAAAVLYRLAQRLGRDGTLSLDDASRDASLRFANLLDWLPAQVLVFTLAVVGHWEAVIQAWKRWHARRHGWDCLEEPGFLGAAACADITVDIEAGDGYVEERSEPLRELVRIRDALARARVAWLAVVALIVLGGWLR